MKLCPPHSRHPDFTVTLYPHTAAAPPTQHTVDEGVTPATVHRQARRRSWAAVTVTFVGADNRGITAPRDVCHPRRRAERQHQEKNVASEVSKAPWQGAYRKIVSLLFRDDTV